MKPIYVASSTFAVGAALRGIEVLRTKAESTEKRTRENVQDFDNILRMAIRTLFCSLGASMTIYEWSRGLSLQSRVESCAFISLFSEDVLDKKGH